MAQAKTATRPEVAPPKFCANCGQTVKGDTAVAAANPSAAFCCNCGFALDSDGQCQNPSCKFCGFIPHCS